METLVFKTENIKSIEKLIELAKGLNLTAYLNDHPINLSLDENIKKFYNNKGNPKEYMSQKETEFFLKDLI